MLLKSIALQQEEELSRLRQEQADVSYAILDGWNAQAKKFPINTSTAIEPPPGHVRIDDTPFGYNYSGLASRFAKRHGRWSEL